MGETTAAQGHCSAFKLLLFPSRVIYLSKYFFCCAEIYHSRCQSEVPGLALHCVLGGIVGPSGLYFSWHSALKWHFDVFHLASFLFLIPLSPSSFFPRTFDLLLGSANLVLLLIVLYGTIKWNPVLCLPLKRKVWCFCKLPLLFISPLGQVWFIDWSRCYFKHAECTE